MRYVALLKRTVVIGLVILSVGCSDISVPDRPVQHVEEVEYTITSDQYLKNRIFRLDLPCGVHPDVWDVPGRPLLGGSCIATNTIRIYKLLGEEEPLTGDVENIAAYVDSTGRFWETSDCPPNDFQTPAIIGARWRPLTFSIIPQTPSWNDYEELVDFGEELDSKVVLAVFYEGYTDWYESEYRIGDLPGRDFHDRVSLPGEEGLFYRMKLLKAPEDGIPYCTYYMQRNIYGLGRDSVNPTNFDLRIGRIGESSSGEVDENGIPYFRLFGLDRRDASGASGHDGCLDLHDDDLFIFSSGLLRFPMVEPFSAGEGRYENYADDSAFSWTGTYLQKRQAPELYDPAVDPEDHEQYGYFRMHITYTLHEWEWPER